MASALRSIPGLAAAALAGLLLLPACEPDDGGFVRRGDAARAEARNEPAGQPRGGASSRSEPGPRAEVEPPKFDKPVDPVAAAKVNAFTEKQAEAYEKNHLAVFPKGGPLCMEAIYNGLAILYSRPEAKFIREKTGSLHMEAIMGLLQKQGKAGKPAKLAYNEDTDSWGPDPEKTILAMTSDTTPGWYFFGLSLHRAYHSVMLVVDRTDLDHPRIYWIDQGANGFTLRTEVTGKLMEHMSWYRPDYGYQYSLVWQLLPANVTGGASPPRRPPAGRTNAPSSAR